MEEISDYKIQNDEAALWWLGQAGYIIRSSDLTVVIDPYLSNSAANGAPEFSRLYEVPIKPSELVADVYIITHDHLDHLDPETVLGFKNTGKTWFIAPRQASRKLISLGIPAEQIIVLNSGDTWRYQSLEISGVFALATSIDVLDTTGYLIKFDNGRSVYHTSDTEFHPLVLKAAPQSPEVMLVPINGKWGNPTPDQAALFTLAVNPKYVMPNHYDLMALNTENPRVFEWFCAQQKMNAQCIIPERMTAFVWDAGN